MAISLLVMLVFFFIASFGAYLDSALAPSLLMLIMAMASLCFTLYFFFERVRD